jgi:DNA-directed RNA polymerase subunit RPC12/RpoP
LAQRVELYKRPDVEAVMNAILSKTGRLDPVFDLQYGYRYPDVETAINKDSDGAVALLEDLYEGGILDSQIYDMEIRCPECGSPNVSTRYLCPVCGSFHIKKTILMEHLDCGYLGNLITFGDPLVCPKCGQPLIEGAYRNAGSIYECADCKKQIDTPFVNHWCRNKASNFSFENAIYQGKFSYFPTKETQEDLERGIIFISPITGIFGGLGLKQMDVPKIVGTSSVELTFDVGYQGAGRKYFVDILQGKELFGEFDILKEYGKITDSKVETFVLVLPGLDNKATTMAKSYKMNVIDAPTVGEIHAKLTSALRNSGLSQSAILAPSPKSEKEDKKPDEKPKSRWRT